HLVAILLLLAAGGCQRPEEPLPPVKKATPELADACVEMPPPPALLLTSTDVATCVPERFAAGLPLEIILSNGRVARFGFYSQCEGRTYTVESKVRDCIQAQLSQWRYMVFEPTCTHSSGEEQVDWLYLMPAAPPHGRTASVGHGCSAG